MTIGNPMRYVTEDQYQAAIAARLGFAQTTKELALKVRVLAREAEHVSIDAWAVLTDLAGDLEGQE